MDLKNYRIKVANAAILNEHEIESLRSNDMLQQRIDGLVKVRYFHPDVLVDNINRFLYQMTKKNILRAGICGENLRQNPLCTCE